RVGERDCWKEDERHDDGKTSRNWSPHEQGDAPTCICPRRTRLQAHRASPRRRALESEMRGKAYATSTMPVKSKPDSKHMVVTRRQNLARAAGLRLSVIVYLELPRFGLTVNSLRDPHCTRPEGDTERRTAAFHHTLVWRCPMDQTTACVEL